MSCFVSYLVLRLFHNYLTHMRRTKTGLPREYRSDSPASRTLLVHKRLRVVMLNSDRAGVDRAGVFIKATQVYLYD